MGLRATALRPAKQILLQGSEAAVPGWDRGEKNSFSKMLALLLWIPNFSQASIIRSGLSSQHPAHHNGETQTRQSMRESTKQVALNQSFKRH